jgi:hypothetical protein
MGPVWRRLDEVWDKTEELDLGAFELYRPYPVLVADVIQPGELRHQRERVKNATMLHMSASGIIGEDRGAQVPRFTDVRRTVSSDFSDWVSIGRTRDNDIMINDYTVSKQHARMRVPPGESSAVVQDTGSTNGTSIAGERLEPQADALVRSAQPVRFGRHTFTFLMPADFYRYLQICRLVAG